MTTFHIYHSYGSLNTKCEPERNMYEHVGDIEASSLQEAYRLSQNVAGAWGKYKVRPTSVGDIIMPEDHLATCFIIMGTGFAEQPAIKWLYYIDWKFIHGMEDAFKEMTGMINEMMKGLTELAKGTKKRRPMGKGGEA